MLRFVGDRDEGIEMEEEGEGNENEREMKGK
jgi:hypothetical protein